MAEISVLDLPNLPTLAFTAYQRVDEVSCLSMVAEKGEMTCKVEPHTFRDGFCAKYVPIQASKRF